MTIPVLQTQHLTKRFGALTAVDDLSLEVYEGEIFGFLGPNGAGKTTSINMMCGLLKPDTGQVLLHGKPVHGGDTEARALVGVCPQETILWDKLTCLEQLEFIGEVYGVPRKVARQRGAEWLEKLGLAAKAGELGGRLSGGMKRRLNIALALVHDPQVIVLDEPEAGLDPQSRVLVRETVRSLARIKTVILTTHNMDEAERVADRVAIIDHGKLVALDTPDALKRTIGEGDVLDIELASSADLEAASALLSKSALTVSTVNHTLTVRGRGLIDQLGALLESLRTAGITLGDVRLRTNTLEDVFLSLTGRRLRE
ncbi:Linearmycin resistance ATP-binding protein LnrL [Anaerolineales bacterium]|nr:Linearmycin resistance ATP-binding protein LnrL [Anaerolineales bacterium]